MRRTVGLIALVPGFVLTLAADTATRGPIRGKVCYQVGGRCQPPKDFVVADRPVPAELFPTVTARRVDNGVAQPGATADGNGEFLILELPVGIPVNIIACGTIQVQREQKRFCGFAAGSARDTQPGPSVPDPSHMTVRAKPVIEPRGQAIEFHMVALGGPREELNEEEDSSGDDLEFATEVVSSKRPIANANVIITDLQTGSATNAKRGNGPGVYLATIQKGTDYVLTVLAEGYEPANFFVYGDSQGMHRRTSDGDWQAGMDIALTPVAPAVSQAPRTAGLLDAAEAMQRFRFDAGSMEVLPLWLRSVDQLALLAPGVVPPAQTWASAGPGIAPGVGTAGQFSVNGVRSRENNFTVDGSDNNDEDVGVRRQGFLTLFPQSLESIVEFQIITALPDARFGRTIGAQVNAVSQPGSSRFHGKLFGYFTDARWSARDFFEVGKSQFPSNNRDLVPITTDGSFAGPPVQFTSKFVDPASLPTPVKVRDRFGYQSNPAIPNSFSRGQYGATFSGPLTRRGTFLSLSFEGLGVHSAKQMNFSVPTVRQRGIFNSGDKGLALPVLGYDDTIHYSDYEPAIPAADGGTAVFSLYPFPNNPLGPYGANTFTEEIPADGRGDLASLRIDRQQSLFGLNNTITARFNRTADNDVLPAVGGALFSSMRSFWRTYNGVFIASTNIRPNLANYFRIGFGQTGAHFDEIRDSYLIPSQLYPNQPFLLNAPVLLNITTPGSPVAYTGVAGDPYSDHTNLPYFDTESRTGPLGRVQIAGFSPVGVDTYHFPQRRSQDTLQWADTLTWIKGRHTLYLGADIRRVHFDNWVERNTRPELLFNGLPQDTSGDLGGCIRGPGCQPFYTALDLAAAGTPAGFLQTVGISSDFSLQLKQTQWDILLQDEFHLSPHLRATLGIRFDFSQLPKDLDQQLSRSFDPTFTGNAIQAAYNRCDSVFGQFPSLVDCHGLASTLLRFLTSQNLNQIFGGNGVTVDPRIGLAWDPFHKGNTVLRGGFGVYTGQFPAIVMNESRSAFPNFAPVNYAYIDYSPRYDSRYGHPDNLSVFTLDSSSADPATQAGNFIYDLLFDLPADPSFNLVRPAANFHNPYAYHASLSLDQSLGRSFLATLSYVGTFGRRLLRISTPEGGFNRSLLSDVNIVSDYNTPLMDGFLVNRTGIKVLDSTDISINREFFDGSANSIYQSLQAQFQGKIPRGPRFGIAFTYAHSIDDASDFFDTAGTPALPQDSLHRSERGSSNFDVRLRAAGHFAWDVFGQAQHGWRRDWLLSGTYMAQSGQPYTVNSTIDWNADGNLTDRLDNTIGLVRSGGKGDARVFLALAPGTDPVSLLAPHFLGQDPSTFADGRVGRNTFTGPRLINMNVAVSKGFAFRESGKIEVRAEAYNLLNRADFGLPVRLLEAPAFGTSVNTIAPPRSLQFGVKVSF